MTMATGLTANRLPSIWNSSALLERRECELSVVAEDLDAVGMDEIEMAYERRDAGAVAPEPSRAAGLSADPGESELAQC